MIAIKLALLLCCAADPAAQQPAAAPQPLSVGNRRQLLFDERFVEQARGVVFRLHPPRKTGQIVIASERPWTLGGYHCVMRDGDVYHLWYTAGGCILYARSVDGIHWEKPDLGLAQSGRRQGTAAAGNVVMGLGAGGVKAATHGVMVFLDPHAPPAEKFRLVANPPEYDRRVQLFSSPDGLHWKLTHRDVISYRDAKHHLDSQNVIFWDERIGKYVAYFRRNLREKGSPTRSVARGESPDLAHFSQVQDSPVVMRSDTRHARQADPGSGAGSPQAVSVLDTYTNGTLKYPWADDAYLMFPTDYFHYGSHLAEFRKEWPVNAGPLDTRLAVSRDGIRWKRYDDPPFVPLGMKGEFDSKRVYIAYGLVPAANDRELYMYYLGTSETHGWGRDDRNNRLLTAAGLAPTGPSAISRLVLRRDGFVSVHAGPEGGQFTTPPIRFEGEQLLLNVDTSAAGGLRVEVLDEQGKPLPGYALADCDVIHTANEISRPVAWKGNSSVDPLAGKPVRLRFVMREVDLYAFQFAARGGI